MELTQKQKAFVRFYVKNNGNGTESAKQAGYSDASAHVQATRMLKNAKVQQAIKDLEQEVYAQSEVTIQEIASKLREISENAKNTSDRIRALELLGKYKGMFKEHEQSQVPLFQVLTKEDVNRLVSERREGGGRQTVEVENTAKSGDTTSCGS